MSTTWIDNPPPKPARTRERKAKTDKGKLNTPLIVLSILVAVGMLVAVLRLRAGGVTLSTVPWWVWTHAACAFLGYRRGVRAGRWVQAIAHTWKGVFSGHKKLIQGKH